MTVPPCALSGAIILYGKIISNDRSNQFQDYSPLIRHGCELPVFAEPSLVPHLGQCVPGQFSAVTGG